MNTSQLPSTRLTRMGTIRRFGNWQIQIRDAVAPCPACGAKLARTDDQASCYRCGKGLNPN